MASEDEWKTVTKPGKRGANRSRARRAHNLQVATSAYVEESSNVSQDSLETLWNDCIHELDRTDFSKTLEDALSRSENAVHDVVCYGIGHFATTTASGPMWQLACAKHIQVILSRHTQIKPELFYFDPCMTEVEQVFLEKHNFHVIGSNERGKRQVRGPTLFFMPHCPMELYCNVIYANWDKLQDVKIFGNSLANYAGRLLADDDPLLSATNLLKCLAPILTEESLLLSRQDIENAPGYFENAFNDSCIVSFCASRGLPPRPELEDTQGVSELL